MMNYKPNKIQWKIGDYIIHDADNKSEHMLAKIVEIKEDNEGKMYRIEYVDEKHNHGEWWNELKYLHDPLRFNILLPDDANQSASRSQTSRKLEEKGK